LQNKQPSLIRKEKKPSKRQNREIIFTTSAASHTEGAVLEKVTSNGEQPRVIESVREVKQFSGHLRETRTEVERKRARRDRWINPGLPFIYSGDTLLSLRIDPFTHYR
jgi:hypothetical protein